MTREDVEEELQFLERLVASARKFAETAAAPQAVKALVAADAATPEEAERARLIVTSGEERIGQLTAILETMKAGKCCVLVTVCPPETDQDAEQDAGRFADQDGDDVT